MYTSAEQNWGQLLQMCMSHQSAVRGRDFLSTELPKKYLHANEGSTSLYKGGFLPHDRSKNQPRYMVCEMAPALRVAPEISDAVEGVLGLISEIFHLLHVLVKPGGR